MVSCSGGIGHPANRDTEPELPTLPSADIQGGPARRVSGDNAYVLDVLAPLQQGGTQNRIDDPSYVVASDMDLAWAMYGVTMTDPEMPVALDLAVSAAPVTAGGTDEPLSFYVGIPNYSAFRWEWSGPYTGDCSVELNSAAAPVNPRRLNSADTLFFVIVAGTPDAQPIGPAALRLTGATVDTSLAYGPMQPGIVVATANAGNDKGPPTPEDPMYISVHWTHHSAKSPEDEVNVADTYYVHRRLPGGSFQLIGSLPAPEEIYVDPLDNDAGVMAPAPGTTYEYYVVAENEQGRSYKGSMASAKSGDLSNTDWVTHRGNNQRTGYNANFAVGGILSQEWDISPAPGTGQDSTEPVIGYDGNILYVGGSAVSRYDFSNGSEIDNWPGYGPLNGYGPATLFGNKLAFPDETSGLNLLDTGDGTLTPLASAAKVWGAPLYMNGTVIFADRGGSVRCYRMVDNQQVWQFSDPAPQPFSLSPAADSDYVYVADEAGRVFKLDAATGAQADFINLTSKPLGTSVALDISRGVLWVSTAKAALNGVSTGSMSLLYSASVTPYNETCVAPALVLDSVPPLVVTAYSKNLTNTEVLAVSLTNLGVRWTHLIENAPATSVSACSDTIFLTKKSRESEPGDELVLLNFEGSEVQRLPLGHTCAGTVLPYSDHVIVPMKNDAHLRSYKTVPISPPLWQDEALGLRGIQNWEGRYESADRNDMRVAWHTAYHPEGLPVKYALFYSADQPPMLQAPYTNTTVISGLTNSDNNTTLVHDLPLGPRYYAVIRAYIGTWGVDHLTDLNNHVIGCTPPWQQRGNYLADGEKFGQVNFMYTPALRMYSVTSTFNDQAVRVFYQGSSNHSEGLDSGLDAYTADAVGIGFYNNQAYAAMANNGVLSVAQRNWPGNWFTPEEVAGANPVVGSPLRLLMGSESGAVYCEYISGSEPTSEIDYFAVRHNGTNWGSPEAIETSNVGGRDLDAVQDPTNPAKLWVAYQKGTTQATTIPGCTTGQLWFARGDGSGGYTKELVDAGTNGASSDCGKRVKVALNGANPCLTYLDLNAANTEPRGRLKYASYNGTAWTVSTVASFNLSNQTGDYRATYGDISLMVTGGVPVIAMLERQTYTPDPAYPTMVVPHVYIKNGASWSEEVPSDPVPTLLKDHEPCFIKPDDSGNWILYFVATPPDSDLPTPGRMMLRYERIN